MSSPVPDQFDRPNVLVRLLQAHARAFFFTLGALVRNPVGSLLTALVIGVTLALPAGFHLALQRVTALSYSWESSTQASLFLKDTVSAARGRELAESLGKRPGVTGTQYISRDQSLEEFRMLSGFGDALDVLDENPLPAVVVVTVASDLPRERAAALMAELGKLPEVEVAKLDQEWLERLQALLSLVQRAVWIAAAGLALAVVVIVGNTIRLDLQSRHEEIAVMKLIGAPAGFIRRPFLYAGLWYGFAGALLAWVLVSVAGLLLAGPVGRVMALYGAPSSVALLSLPATIALLATGVALGLAGALLSVSRHLGKIEPE
jgi:cell division transport system permease protein